MINALKEDAEHLRGFGDGHGRMKFTQEGKVKIHTGARAWMNGVTAERAKRREEH